MLLQPSSPSPVARPTRLPALRLGRLRRCPPRRVERAAAATCSACTWPPCSPAVQCGEGLSPRLCACRGQHPSCRTALRSDSRLVRLARPAKPTLPPSHSCDCCPHLLRQPAHRVSVPSLFLRLLHSSVLTAVTTPLRPPAPSGTKGGHNRRGCTRGHGRRLGRRWWQVSCLANPSRRALRRHQKGEREREREGGKMCAVAGGQGACCVVLRARRVAM